MAKVVANGIQFHYQTKGSGSDVILVHGVTSSLAMWYTKVFPVLSTQFRVTAYDLRGHGMSGMTPTGYTSFDMVQDLVALMDATGIQKAKFIGHSYGGAVALHLALLYPDRVDGVVLLDSGIACLRHMRNLKDWPGWKMYGDQLKEYWITYEEFIELDKSQDVSEIFRKTFDIPIMFGLRRGTSRATPRFQKLINETTIGREFREIAGLTEERLPEITAPVLAFYGAMSPYVNIGAYLGRVLPNCCNDTHAEDGHFYVLREPGAVLQRISRFLHDPMVYVQGEAAVR